LKGVIFLVGMMGAGKTSLGKALAKQTSLPFFDTDSYIKVQTGQSIPEIFSTKGEAAFRKMEEECFYTLTSKAQWIATGGGFPCFNDLMAKMKQLGTVVYLKMTPEELNKRIQSVANRPLLQTSQPINELTRLLIERAEIYETADFVINGNQTTDNLVKEFQKLGLI
jgi:shikimate kinase